MIKRYHLDKVKWIADGGDTFQDSVMRGINNLKNKISLDDYVMVQYGAAPFTSDKIVLNKMVAIKEYNDYVKTLLTILTNYSGIKFLATNREDIIFNNTDIEGFEVKKYINMSLYEMDKVKDEICSGCDIRPVIIDSNVEGIIIVINSECNKEIGKIINILVTSKLDISC